MSETPEPQSGRRRVWVRVLLGISLALNLLVAGLAIGAAMRFGGGRHGPEGRPPPSVGAALYRALPREDRKALRETVKSMHEAPAPGQRESEADAIAAAIRAEPFDADKLEALVEAELVRRHDWFEATQQAWLERIREMTPDQRADYAQRLEEMMQAGPKRH